MILYLTHEERRALLRAVNIEFRFVDDEGDFIIAGLDAMKFRASQHYDWIESQRATIAQFHVCHLVHVADTENLGRCAECGFEALLMYPKKLGRIDSL